MAKHTLFSRVITTLAVFSLAVMLHAAPCWAQGGFADAQGFGGGYNQPPPQQQQGLGFGPSIASGLDQPGGFGGPQTAQQSALGQLDVTFIQGDQIVARVGDDVILLSEVFPLLPALHRNPQAINEQTLAEVRRAVEANLPNLITSRLVLQDFQRMVPEKENRDLARKQFVDHFEEEMIPQIMTQAQAVSRADLMNKLKENGMSLDQVRKTQVDSMVVQVWLRENTRDEREITRDDLLEFYEANAEEFDYPSRARWEQLMIRKKGRTAQQAYNEVANLGNAVVRQRVPFAQVARDRSEGTTKADGGLHDWTTKGSLVSQKLDDAIFTLPVGQMSPIIEDDLGFHIIRVVERKMAGRKPFEEVQDELRAGIDQERRAAKAKEYMAKLRDTIPVASILDGTLRTGRQAPAVQPASATIGDDRYPGR